MTQRALVGIRCEQGHRAYPVADRCPVCTSRDVEQIALAATGTVEAATGAGPVAVGEVRLDDGVLVLARLDGDPLPGAGDRVRFCPDEIVRFERHDR